MHREATDYPVCPEKSRAILKIKHFQARDYYITRDFNFKGFKAFYRNQRIKEK